MAEQLQVIITGKDGVSRVFQEVGKSAQTAGKQVEDAGRKGEQGFKRIGDGAKQAKVGIDDIAGALTVFGAGLAYAGNAALNQQQTMIGLKAAFGDAADEYIRFADELASRSIFNDDDIMRGERYFATLKNNYELTDQQIRQLMETTADLASAYGTSFEDASSRITAAIRGEGEAAEYLGLTMNQQSIDRENLTLTMSNQEAAQFRLNAMYQQTAVYQGTAQTLADSEVGTRARLTNAVQDNAQALGSMIGPLGSMIAGMGFAATGVSSLLGPLGKLGNAAKSSQAGITALSVATNPLTIGFAVAAAGGLYLWKVFEDGKKAANSLKGALEELDSIQNDLLLSGKDTAAQFVANFEDYNRLVDDFAQRRLDAFNALDYAQKAAQAEAEGYGASVGSYILAVRDAYELSKDEAEKFADAQKILGAAFQDSRVDGEALNQALTDLFNQFLAGELTYDQYAESVIALSENTARFRTEMEDTGAVATTFFGIMREGMQGLVTDLKALDTTANLSFGERLMTSLGLDFRQQDRVKTTLDDLRQLFTELPDMPGPGASVDEWREWVNVAEQGSVEWNRRRQVATEALAAESSGNEKLADLMARTNDRRDEGTAALERQARAAALATGAAEKHAAALEADREAMAEWVQVQTDWIAQVLDVAGLGDPLSLWNLAGHADAAMQLADNLGDVAGGMQHTYSAVVGTTDAMGQQLATLDKWALELIGLRGEWSTLDDLLNEGRISLEKYNEAQAAQEKIGAANATVQRDLLAIQAAQAPLLAEGADRYAAYVEQLRALNDGYHDAANGAQQQLSALGFLDEGLASQAMQIAEMAASLDAMGPAGRVAFQGMIEGIIATDPVLTSMLVSMGLVEEKLDAAGNKTYTVNLDGADQAMSDIDKLTTAVVALADVFDDGKLNNTITLETLGLEDVEQAKQAVEDVPETKRSTLELALSDGTKGLADLVTGGATEPVTVPVAFDTGGKSFEDLVAAANNNEPVRVAGQLVIEDAPVLAGDGTGGPAKVTVPGEIDWSDVALDIPQPDPIRVPVELDYGGLGGDAKGRFEQALGQRAAGNVVEVVVNAIDNASPVAEDVRAAVDAIPETVSITVSDGGTMQIAFDNLGKLGLQAMAVDTYDPEITVTTPGAAVSIGLLTATENAAEAIPASVSTEVGVAGAVEAIGLLNGVWSALNAIPDSKTITINTVMTGSNARHGGIPGYAHGGVIAELAEAGPELLHFATGGVAPVYDRGLYPVPLGTYVSPSNANPGLSGRGDIHVDFRGAHFVGTSRAEMDAWAQQSLIPNLRHVIQEERRGLLA